MSIQTLHATPKITLHPYQARLVDELRQAYRKEHHPLLVLPTGGGKTVVSAGLAQSTQEKDRKIWFGCHSDFLLSQTSKTFAEMGVGHGILAAGQPDGMAPTMIVSIDTLRSRMSRIPFRPDVMVWDECHHLGAASWRAIWEWCGPECFHIGLTATPTRLDGKGLAPPRYGAAGFDEIILGPTTAELMEMGFLSRYRAFAPSTVDLSKVHRSMGEYNTTELQAEVDRQVLVGDIVKHYQELAPGKRFIYFCVSVDYSKRLAAAFTASGIPARHVDATSSSQVRADAAIAFARGELQVLTNVGLFGEGYDLAAQAGMPVTVEGVGLCRPTLSESLAIQMMGRCLRAKDYPGLILDHAGIIQGPGGKGGHGLPDSDREWSLLGKVKREQQIVIKTCPNCLAQVPGGLAVCDCGHRFNDPKEGGGREIQHVDGTLEEITLATFNARRKDWKTVVGACKSYGDFVKAGKFLGYAPGWAFVAHREFQKVGYVLRRGKL